MNAQVVFAYRHRRHVVDAVEIEQRVVVSHMRAEANEASNVLPEPFPHRDVLGIPDDGAIVLAP